MAKQPDITNGMRAILVDWLVEVVQEFKLEPQTFYLSMSIVDRFLSCMSVLRSKLQLVGTASIYIAAKFEEIYPPEIADFVYITDDTYTKSQVQWNPSIMDTWGPGKIILCREVFSFQGSITLRKRI